MRVPKFHYMHNLGTQILNLIKTPEIKFGVASLSRSKIYWPYYQFKIVNNSYNCSKGAKCDKTLNEYQ